VLKHGLRTWNGRQQVRAGTSLLMYSIVKYELDTLLGYLSRRGLELKGPDDAFRPLIVHDDPADLGNERKQKSYAVFAAIRP
jgi:hypothetical protein